ncbi:beta-galactosidase [Phaeacidiphilus oryzae]|uniref:beta-galactosidase n=1 Tax=Phaeacidiphilus oryzae TaxID=348818 RepID=UPI00055C29E2|nr:beta-galactosidase [Phaeacidiphilus oryzae]
MERRRFVQIGALGVIAPLTAMALSQNAEARNAGAAAQTPSASGHSFGFAPDGSAFLLDGKPFQIRSGEIHPSRIPVPYWRQRIRMAKAMGLNTVSLYVMWNYHEYREGHFDFRTGNRDIAGFIRLCQAEGMWVLLRPGPYVCGEWDLGGIPAWLLRYPDIRLRTDSGQDPHYMAAARRYIAALAAEVRPLFAANGGPVLMLQVENEYGSYGNDAAYVAEVRQAWEDNGITGPFYTEDGLGQLEANHTETPGGAIGLSGGDAASIAQARKAFPTVPAMAGELYPGWLTHWGDDGFQGADSDVTGDLRALMDGGLSFNLYMAHGGTSFGWWAGANASNDGSDYQPDITSYDYCAPITEQGRKGPRYDAYRALIGGYAGVGPLPPVPAPVPTVSGLSCTPRPYASLWDNLERASAVTRLSGGPEPYEYHGQVQGFAVYRHRTTDAEAEAEAGASAGAGAGSLVAQGVHDYATVFVDGRYAGGVARPAVPAAVAAARGLVAGGAPLAVGQVGAGSVLDLLVEGMGHINYGHGLVDRKGITGQVALDGAALSGWTMYQLPMDEEWVAGLRPVIGDPSRPGLFFRGLLSLSPRQVADTYLDMSAWAKGAVWVNGHNLGRYWETGPQHRLYCPAEWLRPGANEILVLDLHRTASAPVTLADTLG